MTFSVLQAVAAALALVIHLVLAAVMLGALALLGAIGIRSLRRRPDAPRSAAPSSAVPPTDHEGLGRSRQVREPAGGSTAVDDTSASPRCQPRAAQSEIDQVISIASP